MRAQKLPTIVLVTALLALTSLGAWASSSAPGELPVAVFGYLPSPRYSDPAFIDASAGAAYVVGGAVGVDEIVRVDLATGESTVVAHLPGPREGPCVAWDPIARAAYVFFGWTGGSHSSEIVRFSPDTAQVQVIASASQGNSHCTALWDSNARVAYVLGGDRVSMTDEVARFDPATATYQVLSVKLPSGRSHMGQAAWDPVHGVAYVAGGWLGGDSRTDEIVKFVPSTGTVTVVGHMRQPAYGQGVVWVDGAVYLFGGGVTGTAWTDTVYRFDPAGGPPVLLLTRLPFRMVEMGIAAFPCRDVLLFGGSYIGEGGELLATNRVQSYRIPDRSVDCAVQTFLDALAGTESRVLEAIEAGRVQGHEEHVALTAAVTAGRGADASEHASLQAALERDARALAENVSAVLREVQANRAADAEEHGEHAAAVEAELIDISGRIGKVLTQIQSNRLAEASEHVDAALALRNEARALSELMNGTFRTISDTLDVLVRLSQRISDDADALARFLQEERASEPLTLQGLSPGAGTILGAHDHWVLVALRGTPADAEVKASLVGDDSSVRVTREARGIYRIHVVDEDLGGQAILVRAQVKGHAGSALLWDGRPDLPLPGRLLLQAPVGRGSDGPAESGGNP